MPSTPEVWLNEFQANTTDSGPTDNDQGESVVIQLDNGNIVVLYEDDSDGGPAGASGTDIIGQIYDPLGNPIGGEFRANQSFFADDEGDFDAVALPGGRFVVVYEDDPGADTDVAIRATEWNTDALGVTTSTTRTIATSPDTGDIVSKPAVDAFDDGSYVVVFEDFDSSASSHLLKAVVVDAAGVVGTEFTAVSGSDTAGADTDVAVLSNGDFAAVYDFDTTDDAIAYSVRDISGGSTTGGAFVANTSTNGDTDTDASIVALEGGGFVISWTNIDANDTDIEFQRYDNAGVAQGGVVTVDSGGATDNNNESHLIALTDGGFVVAYDDDEFNNLSFQRYNATGGSVGSTVVVNNSTDTETQTSGYGLEDGRFIVGWTERSGGDDDVFVEFYDPRDAPNDPGVYTPDQWVVGTVGNDTFTPNGNAEFTHGWDGDDVITESGGTREYYGDAGNDTINVVSPINADLHDGGTGNDTVDWEGASGSVSGATFDLAAGTATLGPSSEVMTNFENLNGTNNDDTILGTGGSNILDGNDGNDFIEGGGGLDTLDGGLGNDTLQGGFSTDSVDGGAGDDVIEILDGQFIDDVSGGSGNDSLDLSDIAGASEAVTIDTDTGTFTGFGGTQSITGIENVRGTQEADFIRLDTGANEISGEGGNDTLQGGFSTDSVDGGAGDDLIQVLDGEFFDNVDGGTGNDTLDHSDVTRSGDTFDFLAGEIISTFDSGTPTLAGIETYLDGSGGNTIISDGSGAFFGNGGNDLILAGLGSAETLDGGLGNDTLDTTSFAGDYEVNLATGGTNFPPESFTNFENIVSGTGDDTLTGTSGANRMEGGGGVDFIFGEGGNDTLDGGTSRDSMEGGTGNDTYLTDDRRDRVTEGAGAGDDTVIATADTRLGANVEDLVLDGLAADDLIGLGNGEANEITGDGGDNLIRGRGNNDTITGGAGDDRLDGDAGSDELAGGTGLDFLVGDGGSDTLTGGADDDTLDGGNGVDELTGGSGSDQFRFRDAYGFDTITDFDDGFDLLDFRDIREENGNAPLVINQLLIEQVGVDVRISLDLDQDGTADSIDLDGDGSPDNNRIEVLNSNVGDFTAADFIF